ncbi:MULTISPECIES: hypothetical protein [Thermomonospora]|uniref:Secreted protein n=1 Tax=Thermomonospora curvata (strain ATCC 19995 / DSM 43183 / JCM 3096 / KCTC 9072 / NBRC 15933 / NCIMB 10081 / Henssen B9) TaxID=471852 RepID=D1A390_THECD|nr:MULTISPECIES: hypothetical protein [Thermomonospora]ACY99860.1 hypothetical protein Tcur_4333 [Thermomonospora curvata DSM 43183]PKK12863.1 MAG: hypothetical protein BUE48_021285 [Thermomonospora sp. CIF 1]
MSKRSRMTGRGRPAGMVAAPLAVAVAAAGAVALTAAPAQALCGGKGVADTGSLYANGYLIARETVQYASTCDGDNYYAGKVLDARTDGSCAYARYYDAGVWSTQGVSCTTGAYANYSWRDRNGDRSATIRIAVDYGYAQDYTWGY